MKWTFTGGISSVDNQTYSAVIVGSSPPFFFSSTNPYPNGSFYFGTSQAATIDLVFEGNFNPIPFEFEASGGVAIWGGAWLLRKQLQKRKVTKD